MTPAQKLALMASILKRAKLIAPRRVPKADDTGELAAVWAEELPLDSFPPLMWKEVVTWWAGHSGDAHLEPAGLKLAAFAVRDRWETIPEKRTMLENHRAARQSDRISRGALPVGTTPAKPLTALPGTKKHASAKHGARYLEQWRKNRPQPPQNTETPQQAQQDALNNLEALVNKHTKGDEAT